MNYSKKLLIVDDDLEILKVYKKIFEINGFPVIAAPDAQKALRVMENDDVAVVITDIIMPKIDGVELLSRIKAQRPEAEVILLTAEGSVAGAVEAVHRGALTYLVKPADIEELILNVKRAYELYELKMGSEAGRVFELKLDHEKLFLGENQKMKEIRQKIRVIAPMDTTVLITGESGTGKEIVANLIHQNSSRSEGPFVRVNCAALSEGVLESELFGHEKGAFTGADRMRKGRFEMAGHGTLLLDEIGELPLNTQAKLLRVLQEKEFERVGSSQTMKADFRLIASTNRNLREATERGIFRKDLYYRINVLPIFIPPLRERRDDIPILVSQFGASIAQAVGLPAVEMPEEVMRRLLCYSWPGNVRELKNVIERLVVMGQGQKIAVDDLPEEILQGEEDLEAAAAEKDSLVGARKDFEKHYILKALQDNDWNITKTAAALNIARKNLYRKLKEYEIIPH